MKILRLSSFYSDAIIPVDMYWHGFSAICRILQVLFLRFQYDFGQIQFPNFISLILKLVFSVLYCSVLYFVLRILLDDLIKFFASCSFCL